METLDGGRGGGGTVGQMDKKAYNPIVCMYLSDFKKNGVSMLNIFSSTCINIISKEIQIFFLHFFRLK
jgi:hypothetical protein